jgi:phosphoglycolate phosphatase-like HAD superfamily hydrolase
MMNLAVFDIDGTLTATNESDDACFVRALAEACTIPNINENWDEYEHVTDSGITAQIFREHFAAEQAQDQLRAFQSHFMALLREQAAAAPEGFGEIPGAAAALRRLVGEDGWGVAVATGCWRDSALLKLGVAGINVEGLPAAFAEDGPSREGILRAAVARASAHYGARDFGKVVSVGDGLWDVRAARNLRMAFVGVGAGERGARLRAAGAAHVVEDFKDFNRFLEYLNDARVPALTV